SHSATSDRLPLHPFLPLSIHPPPRPNLFPYTTLFRSVLGEDLAALRAGLQPGQREFLRFQHEGELVLHLLRGLPEHAGAPQLGVDRKSTRLNSSHGSISYAVFCLKKKTN